MLYSIDKKKLISALVSQSYNNVAINNRVYVSYSPDETINTRYWLAFGILSSGVKDQTAQVFSQKISTQIGSTLYHEDFKNVISDTLTADSPTGRYRFPNIRSEWIHQSYTTLQKHENTLPIDCETHFSKQRDVIISLFTGIGLKQASLLLRNLGYSFDCCVLDTHIIDFLIWIDWLPSKIKKLTINRKRYFAIESLFKRLSDMLHIPIPILDIAMWDLTRMAKASSLK
jgi:thermostable 8-oxoguanine DNA glycosylase